MKAKVTQGAELLFMPGMRHLNNIGRNLIINFAQKGSYIGHKQYDRNLEIETNGGIVVVTFTGEPPILTFDSYEKDQLVLVCHTTSP